MLSALSALSALIGRLFLRITGWRIYGQPVTVDKCIFIIAPHMSNWDFVYGMAAKWSLGFPINYLGKASLFKPPFGWWFRATGGVAVERTAVNGLVQVVVEQFRIRERFRFALAPEGTRKTSDCWKSGFYQIAVKAGVPIQPIAIDLKKRCFVFGHLMEMSGEVSSDMDQVRAFYEGLGVLNATTTPVRLRSEIPKP